MGTADDVSSQARVAGPTFPTGLPDVAAAAAKERGCDPAPGDNVGDADASKPPKSTKSEPQSDYNIFGWDAEVNRAWRSQGGDPERRGLLKKDWSVRIREPKDALLSDMAIGVFSDGQDFLDVCHCAFFIFVFCKPIPPLQ